MIAVLLGIAVAAAGLVWLVFRSRKRPRARPPSIPAPGAETSPAEGPGAARGSQILRALLEAPRPSADDWAGLATFATAIETLGTLAGVAPPAETPMPPSLTALLKDNTEHAGPPSADPAAISAGMATLEVLREAHQARAETVSRLVESPSQGADAADAAPGGPERLRALLEASNAELEALWALLLTGDALLPAARAGTNALWALYHARTRTLMAFLEPFRPESTKLGSLQALLGALGMLEAHRALLEPAKAGADVLAPLHGAAMEVLRALSGSSPEASAEKMEAFQALLPTRVSTTEWSSGDMSTLRRLCQTHQERAEKLDFLREMGRRELEAGAANPRTLGFLFEMATARRQWEWVAAELEALLPLVMELRAMAPPPLEPEKLEIVQPGTDAGN